MHISKAFECISVLRLCEGENDPNYEVAISFSNEDGEEIELCTGSHKIGAMFQAGQWYEIGISSMEDKDDEQL